MHTVNTQQGVTLVELVVTIAVLAILVTLASPSLTDFAERQAIKGAAESIVGVIAQAKEEAVKRDKPVRVEFTAWGAGVCAGAIEGSSTACDCSQNTCPLASSAESERDLKRIKLASAPAFGGGTFFVIDPKTGTLLDPGATGSLQLSTAGGYTVQVSVNALARPAICVPSGNKVLPGVQPCA